MIASTKTRMLTVKKTTTLKVNTFGVRKEPNGITTIRRTRKHLREETQFTPTC